MSAFLEHPSYGDLPICGLLEELGEAVKANSTVILEAAPGAGKTTIVPLYLRAQDCLAGKKILMLEPRRLATRAAAARMAELLGQELGEDVGYRMRMEQRVGPKTVIEVMTEGTLIRRLQSDPELADVGLIIFDEFHERSLDADLGLALALDLQQGLRADLRLLIMSATLEGDRIEEDLRSYYSRKAHGEPFTVTCLRSEGRSHPLELRYLGRPKERLENAITQASRAALRESQGDLLVFLPGEGEIRRCAENLAQAFAEESQVKIHPLYARLPDAEQRAALSPAPPGQRKILLASSIAESSLTIEGLSAVIDSGLTRQSFYDARASLTFLETRRVSLASARQRAGRAARQGPGLCYRLWAEPETQALRASDDPEILRSDLSAFHLQIAAWGAQPDELFFLTAAPPGHSAQALDLLKSIKALDEKGQITAAGREIADLPLPPRLAQMLRTAQSWNCLPEAAALAALLIERDPLARADKQVSADITHRLLDLARGQGPYGRIKRVMERIERQLEGRSKRSSRAFQTELSGRLLALAFPDRIAKSRDSQGGFKLANGRGVLLDPADPLAQADYLVCADLGGLGQKLQVRLAARLSEEDLRALYKDQIEVSTEALWDGPKGVIRALQVERFGSLKLSQKAAKAPTPEARVGLILDRLRNQGLAEMNWDKGARTLQQRQACLSGQGIPLPDLSEEALAERLEDWLAPYLTKITSLSDLQAFDPSPALLSLLSYPDLQRLEKEAPLQLTLPSGRRATIDYSDPQKPFIMGKLQEFFGLEASPSIAQGRLGLTIHLLSPAGRPLQITSSLKTFWVEVYPDVRKEMKGRYPKHPWPEDPLSAPATRKTKKALERAQPEKG